MPPDGLRNAVEVLVELPADPRLADPGDARDRDEVCLALVCRSVEEILDQAQLSVAAHERGFEARRLQLPARTRDDPQRAPQRHGLRLPLELVLAGVLEGDRRLRRTPRRLPD